METVGEFGVQCNLFFFSFVILLLQPLKLGEITFGNQHWYSKDFAL